MSGNTVDIDDALNVLKSSERRRVLEYLDDESVESTTVTDLASHLVTSKSEPPPTESRDEQTFAARLHHVHLPKLADHGLLEYDARSTAIRYRADAHVEKMLACLHEEC